MRLRFGSLPSILDRVGEEAYRLALPMSLAGILDVLFVSQIRRDIPDLRYVLDCLVFRVELESTIAEYPVRFWDCRVR